MDYVEVCIKLTPFRPFNEIVVAQLGELPFDSFLEEEDDSLVKAYILENEFDEESLKSIFNEFEGVVELEYEVNTIEKVNWNQQWEDSFEPVEVGSFCVVRAPFHAEKPSFQYEVIIEPKMSFGTGHHQTTCMMIELMENIDFAGKKVLDMGSGTGILAILAKKMDAEAVDAIDIEEWAYENMKENFVRNSTEVSAFHGGEEVISTIGKQYDIIIANINKNILLAQFDTYSAHLKKGGLLLLSGFYITDKDDLIDSKELAGFKLMHHLEKDSWCALKLQKHG